MAGLLVVLQATGVMDRVHDRKEIEAWLRSHEALAPALYIGISSVLPLVFFPRSLLMLSGGLLFGWPALLYSLLAVGLSDMAAFWGARLLARPLVHKLSAGRARRTFHWLRQEGFWAVLILAMTPVAPTWMINYGSGAAGIRYARFAPGSLLGILPLCAIYTYYGGLLDEGTLDFLYSLPLFALPILLVLGLLKWRFSEMERDAPAAASATAPGEAGASEVPPHDETPPPPAFSPGEA